MATINMFSSESEIGRLRTRKVYLGKTFFLFSMKTISIPVPTLEAMRTSVSFSVMISRRSSKHYRRNVHGCCSLPRGVPHVHIEK